MNFKTVNKFRSFLKCHLLLLSADSHNQHKSVIIQSESAGGILFEELKEYILYQQIIIPHGAKHKRKKRKKKKMFKI